MNIPLKLTAKKSSPIGQSVEMAQHPFYHHRGLQQDSQGREWHRPHRPLPKQRDDGFMAAELCIPPTPLQPSPAASVRIEMSYVGHRVKTNSVWMHANNRAELPENLYRSQRTKEGAWKMSAPLQCHPEGLQGVWQPSLVPWGALGSSHPPAEGVSGIVPPAQ